MVAGVTLTAAGAVTLGLDQNLMCPILGTDPYPPPECEMGFRTNQVNIGAGLTAAGGALVLTGVGLLVWPGPRRLVPARSATGGR